MKAFRVKTRVLILSDRPKEPVKQEAERRKFALFARALAQGGIEAEHRFLGGEGELRTLVRAWAPDLVFSAPLYCTRDDGGLSPVHAVLEEEGSAYIGSDPAVLELAIDKSALKERWQGEGIRTPAYVVASRASPLDEARALAIGFPCIVKPAREGNSRGIGEDSVVRSMEALRSRTDEIVGRFGSAIVERFLGDSDDVREFTVASIGSGVAALVMPAEIELEAPRTVRVVTTADKDGGHAVARPVPDRRLRADVEDFARGAFAAAGVRDYSRCDIIMSGGELYALEINGQPMVPDPWFAACASGAGLDETGYLNAIVLASLSRNAAERGIAAPIPEAMRDLMPRAVYGVLTGRGR